jgi:predicted flap endonuclease-1-like 5' DNA nuclease
MDTVQIAAVRGRYYQLLKDGYNPQQAAAIAQGQLPASTKPEPKSKLPSGPRQPFTIDREPPPPQPQSKVEQAPVDIDEADAPPPKATTLAGDDLTRIQGVGSGTVRRLAELGVTKFSDIAKWTDEEVADFDARLRLRGRIKREDWVGQAKKLA